MKPFQKVVILTISLGIFVFKTLSWSKLSQAPGPNSLVPLHSSLRIEPSTNWTANKLYTDILTPFRWTYCRLILVPALGLFLDLEYICICIFQRLTREVPNQVIFHKSINQKIQYSVKSAGKLVDNNNLKVHINQVTWLVTLLFLI